MKPFILTTNTNNWRTNLRCSKEMESATNTFDNNNANIQLCNDTNLTIMKWLIEKSNERNYQQPDELLSSGFRNSVIQKHLEVAKWLFEISEKQEQLDTECLEYLCTLFE